MTNLERFALTAQIQVLIGKERFWQQQSEHCERLAASSNSTADHVEAAYARGQASGAKSAREALEAFLAATDAPSVTPLTPEALV